MARYDRGEAVTLNNASKTFRRIGRLIQGHEKTFALGVGLTIVRTGVIASLPLVFRAILDGGISESNTEFFFYALAFYALLLVLQGALEYIQSLVVGFMSLRIVADLKGKLFAHVLTLSARFFDENETGKLISRIESDAQRLYSLFAQVGLQLTGAVLTIVFSLGVMLSVSVELTAASIVTAPFILAIGTYFFRKLRPRYRQDRANYATLAGVLAEHIPQIPLLRTLHNTDWSLNKMRQANDEKYRYSIRLEILQTSIWFFVMLTPLFALTLLLWVGASRVTEGSMSVGTLWMFVQYVFAAISPIITVSEQINEAQRALGSADRVFNLLDSESDLIEPKEALPLTLEREVRFQNVSFAYKKDENVLTSINLTIPKGTSFALVGATGSGKTTISALLSRWYDPTAGSILFDDTDIRQVKKDDLASLISVIPQDVFLFPGSVADNIRGMRADISRERVEAAVEELGIGSFVASLPQGLDTQVGERGGNLSLGERQLLAFARAIALRPEILIIDEATSSIDPKTEALLQKSVDKLLKGRTSLIIAHRLSTIKKASSIVVLEKGRIVEMGTHEELLNLGGRYATMVALQEREGR